MIIELAAITLAVALLVVVSLDPVLNVWVTRSADDCVYCGDIDEETVHCPYCGRDDTEDEVFGI